MKLHHSILTAALAVAMLSPSARAVTFQVAADTAGSPVTNKITKAAGTATTLPVSKNSAAYISFGVGDSGIDPNTVTGARLVIFFPRVSKPGNLTLFANGSAFTEIITPPAKTIPTPTTGATIGSPIAVSAADSKNFLTVDVTAQVKAWLTNPATDFGFGIRADSPTSTVNALIGSKEGSGSGYPAVLEVDGGVTTFTGTNATFSGNLAATNANLSGNLTVTNANGNFFVEGGFGDDGHGSSLMGVFTGTNLGPQLRFQNTASDTGTIYTDIGQDANNNFIIQTGGDTTRFTLLQNGNVGIGTTTPNAPLQVKGLVNMGTQTGTSQAPNRAGLVVRRINSTNSAAGQVVARSSADVTLERDGTPGGFVIKIANNAGAPVFAGTGVDQNGSPINVYIPIFGGGAGTTTHIFTTAQGVGHFHLSFGDPDNAADMTEVVLTRFIGGGNDPSNWIGTVTSTFDQ